MSPLSPAQPYAARLSCGFLLHEFVRGFYLEFTVNGSLNAKKRRFPDEGKRRFIRFTRWRALFAQAEVSD
jgi:hypothetical protein